MAFVRLNKRHVMLCYVNTSSSFEYWYSNGIFAISATACFGAHLSRPEYNLGSPDPSLHDPSCRVKNRLLRFYAVVDMPQSTVEPLQRVQNSLIYHSRSRHNSQLAQDALVSCTMARQY